METLPATTENLIPATSERQDADSAQEIENLENEQGELELSREAGEISPEGEIVSLEDIAIRQEEIRDRIVEIEKEKRQREELLTHDFKSLMAIIKMHPGSAAKQWEIIVSQEIFTNLPTSLVEEITLNKEKFNFVDYDLVSEELKKDPFAGELESLQIEKADNSHKAEVIEYKEQERISALDKLKPSEIEDAVILEEIPNAEKGPELLDMNVMEDMPFSVENSQQDNIIQMEDPELEGESEGDSVNTDISAA